MQKTMFWIITATCIGLSGGMEAYAQERRVGIGTTEPQSVLDVVSTTRGVLIPRMTASEIEAIVSPSESELVFAVTGDGTSVNKTGFWFFQSGTWKPLTDETFVAENIYTNDGTLESPRVVNQDGKALIFGPNLVHVNGSSASVGVLTDAPTRTMDVNGGFRTQSLNAVNNVVSSPEGVLMHEVEFFEYGDVKPSYLSADHDGWYLLNGRAVSELPANAQANVVEVLGSVTNLPDATNRYSMGTTAAPGTTTGSNAVVLARANLPNVSFSYTTTSAGAHSHTFAFGNTRINSAHGGGNNIHVYWLGGTFSAGANYNINTSTLNHNHTFSVNSGGSGAPLNIAPRAINFNYFVYLGQ
ncbi:hypothetical protein ACFOET_19520 [Parapedobacter deserti]|uniref:Tail fiber protein n=1 Tax=Parapedobacter deserti TaxID=1912957 RepID=A0ABV7JRK0_9SPHI